MMAGLAGCLLANQAEFVSPAYMTWQRSGELIFMVVLGGLGSLHGAVIGAAAVPPGVGPPAGGRRGGGGVPPAGGVPAGASPRGELFSERRDPRPSRGELENGVR